MPYEGVLQSGTWALTASVFLSACAGIPGRGVPERYEQSFDSATSSCRQNPALCARMAGEETVVPEAAQRLAEAGASVAAVGMALDGDLKTRIEQALQQCAEHARTQVLLDELGGRAPTPEECNGVMPGRNVTLAMFLGERMHEVALECAGARLSELRPGGFSLEQRYRFDRSAGKTSLVSAEEAQSLLRQWRGGELRGTLVPDVVIHSGNPLRAEVIYDFKFSCANSGGPASWSRYPEGHPYQRLSQKDMYQEALGVTAWRVAPWLGILP